MFVVHKAIKSERKYPSCIFLLFTTRTIALISTIETCMTIGITWTDWNGLKFKFLKHWWGIEVDVNRKIKWTTFLQDHSKQRCHHFQTKLFPVYAIFEVTNNLFIIEFLVSFLSEVLFSFKIHQNHSVLLFLAEYID